jgi:predicted phosphodiesterase
MKLQLSSDLHLEMRKGYELPVTDADVIVLGGDVHIGIKAIQFAIIQAERQRKPVLIVAGNHEYYHQDYGPMLQQFRELAATCPLVHFLENDEVIIDGVRFLGCTLWTDYLGDGSEDQESTMAYISNVLTDHHVIRNASRHFSPQDALAIHVQSKVWLEAKLIEPFEGQGTVVITHHGPSIETQHKRFDYGPVSAAFLSNFDDELIDKSDMWIYGHSHSNVDTMIGKCRLISNQMGYPGEGLGIHKHLPDFQSGWVVSL